MTRLKSSEVLINTLSQDGYWMVNKKIAQLLGNDGAILLSDLVSKYKYFKTRKLLEDDCFYNTSESLEKDCNVSRYVRRDIFQKLQDIGFLKIDKKGFPPKNYYYIQHDIILDFLLSEPEDPEKTEITNTYHSGENLPHHSGENLPHHWGKNLPHHSGENLPHHWGKNLPHIVNSNKNKEIKINKEEESHSMSSLVLIVDNSDHLKEFARRARDTLLKKTPKTAANSYKVEDQVVAFTELIFGDLPYEWWKFENGKRKTQPGKIPPVAYQWNFNTTEKFEVLADLATEWLKKPKVFYEKSDWTQESYESAVVINLKECLFNNDSYLTPEEQSEKNKKAKQDLAIDKQKSQEISLAISKMQKIEQEKKNGLIDMTRWTLTKEELDDADRAGYSRFYLNKTTPCVEEYVNDFIEEIVDIVKASLPDSFKYPEWVENFTNAIVNVISARPDWTWKNPECKTALEATHALVRKYCLDDEG